MRAGFGLVALVVALLIVALLSRQALRSQSRPMPAATAGSEAPARQTPRQQVDAVQRDVQQALDAAAARRASDAE